MTVVKTTSQLNDQESSTDTRQFLIEVPGNLDVSPAVLFRYLAEKFANVPIDQNEDGPADYLIRPKQTSVSLSGITDKNGARQIKSPSVHSPANSGSSLEVSFLPKYLVFVCHIFTDLES